MWDELASLANRFGALGDTETDTHEQRLQHRFLVWMGSTMSLGGLLWGTLIWVTWQHWAAVVPFGYAAMTVANLAVFRATRRFEVVRELQIVGSVGLPLALQLALGGHVASGGVMWWSVLALVGSLTFSEPRHSLRWTVLFFVGIGAAAALDPMARAWAVPSSDAFRTGLAALNTALIATMLYGLTLQLLAVRRADNVELAAANERVSALASDLSAQVRRAEAAEAEARAASVAKSTFLANMSHELRTPLNAILGYAELLAEEHPELGAGDLSRIRGAGEHLLSMISDILDLAKIEAGRSTVELAPCDCAALVRQIAGTMAPVFAKNRNRVVVEAPPEAIWLTDAAKVRQILFNLLGNAAKFTSDGCVTVRLGSDGGGLRLEVTDTGVGMTKEQVQRVGRPFVQADSSTTRRFGGTGLGLHLVSEFARLLGGDLAIESAPGRGTKVVVRLPDRAEA